MQEKKKTSKKAAANKAEKRAPDLSKTGFKNKHDKKTQPAARSKTEPPAVPVKGGKKKPSPAAAPKQAPAQETKARPASAQAAAPRKKQKTAAVRSKPAAQKKPRQEPAYPDFSDRSVRVIFLGGINEIGKNLTVFEYADEMVILDCGMTFPDADMPGIDYVLPDMTFIERNADKIKAVFITHGHEDHIGGLPYLLKIANFPIYASKLTAGLIESKLREHGLYKNAKLHVISPGDVTDVGAFSFEAIHVNHSIPDSLAFAIRTGAGLIVHTGDFKIDNTPIDGGVIDLQRLAALGDEGVLCLMQDSTNAERAGYTPSEKMVGETLQQLFARGKGKRIIVASFASNIHRIQQIIDASVQTGRKIFFSGRSLENVTAISFQLGFLRIPDGILLPIDRLKNYRDEEVVIITTGSQGEPMSALSRMALGDHRKVIIGSNDYVIISATPIPGNEKTVANTINELMRLGAEVVYEKSLGIHVSGHAAQEELKLIMNLVRPKFFIPVHGEQKHMRRHAALAQSVGIDERNIVIPELGSILRLTDDRVYRDGTAPSGRVFIDSSGVGNVGLSVLSDRKALSNDGVLVVSAVVDGYSGELVLPLDIQSKGFVYEQSAAELMKHVSNACEAVLDQYKRSYRQDPETLRQRLHDMAAKAVFERTRRSPVILVNVFSV